MNKLNLQKYNFTIQFTKETKLPTFVGNTLRGTLGQSLHAHFPDIYTRVFKVNSIYSIPNPFVISTPYPGKDSYSIGDTLDFTITLLGSACNYKNEVISAVKLMCMGKLEYVKIINIKQIYMDEWNDNSTNHIPHTDKLTLHFLTPTEILSSKEPLAEPDFQRFIDSLFGRIGSIIDHYTDGEFVVPYSLIAAKPYVKADYELRHIEFHTNKQPIHGFLGTIRYSGDVTRYMPYIELGSLIHIGKKTTRACGEYSFETGEEFHQNEAN